MFKEINLAGKVFLSNFEKLSLPYKLTLAITYNCNSKCSLCHIWKLKPRKEMVLKEIKEFFQKNDYFNWVDLTGGEPFLKKDVVEICGSIIDNCPYLYLLHIPTNGFLPKKIEGKVKEILNFKPHRFIISIAIDGPKVFHDKSRGVNGGWQKAIETYKRLKKLKQKNFEVYFGMTLSGFNYGLIEKTYQEIKREIRDFRRDGLHFNIAHQSFYYNNLEIDLKLNKKIIFALKAFNAKKGKTISGVNFLESRYQRLIPDYLKTKKSPLFCQSLRTSLFIDPLGDIYPCSMWERKITNLKNVNYDLRNIYQSDKLYKLKEEIKDKKCPGCWTPCEAYQTILGNLLKNSLR